MRILVINCSPVRNGATAEIVRLVGQAVQEGNEVRSICIDDYHVGFCKGCRTCHETARCIPTSGRSSRSSHGRTGSSPFPRRTGRHSRAVQGLHRPMHTVVQHARAARDDPRRQKGLCHCAADGHELARVRQGHQQHRALLRASGNPGDRASAPVRRFMPRGRVRQSRGNPGVLRRCDEFTKNNRARPQRESCMSRSKRRDRKVTPFACYFDRTQNRAWGYAHAVGRTWRIARAQRNNSPQVLQSSDCSESAR